MKQPLFSSLSLIGRLYSFVFMTLLCSLFFSSCGSSNNDHTKPSKALMLVWNVAEKDSFWKDYRVEIFPILQELHNTNKVKYAFPFEHQVLKHPTLEGQWTNSVLIGVDSKFSPKISDQIIQTAKEGRLSTSFVAADLLNLQKGLDMFYSIEDGIKTEGDLQQILEYVFSDSLARKKYYGEQYIFSGPAMQELHSNNNAGRFIGFEVDRRLYGTQFPAWDLFHVVGFTKEQTERATPIFMDIWNRHAERAFGEGMTFLKKKKEWDKIRINVKSNATQYMELTLPIKKDNK